MRRFGLWISRTVALAVVAWSCTSATAYAGPRQTAEPGNAGKSDAKLRALSNALTEAIERSNANANNGAVAEASVKAAKALIAAAEAAPLAPRAAGFAARGYVSLASEAHSSGRRAESVAAAERAYALIRAQPDADPDVFIQAISLLADDASSGGRFADAVRLLSEASDFLVTFRRAGKVAETPSSLAMAESNTGYSLSIALVQLGRYDEAVVAQANSVAARVIAVGPLHPATIAARTHLAMRLVRAGRAAESEAMARTASEQAVVNVPKSDLGYVRSFEALALVLAATGKRAEAVDVARRALELRAVTTGRADFNYATSLYTLATLLIDLERFTEAAPLLEEALRIGDTLGANRSQTDQLRQLNALGLAQFASGTTAKARATLEKGFALWAKNPASGTAETLLPALALARLDDGDTAGAADAVSAHLGVAKPAVPLPALGYAQACGIAALLGRTEPACANSPAGTRLTRTADERLRATYDGELQVAERLMLEIAMRLAIETSDTQLAVNATRLIAGSKVAAATRMVASRAVVADSALSGRQRGIQDAEARYRRANTLYLQKLGTADATALRPARESALAAMATLQRDFTRDYPALAALGADAEVSLATIRSALAPGDAALGIVPTLASTFVIMVTPDSATVHRIAVPRVAFASQIEGLRTSIDGGSFDAGLAHSIYNGIFSALPRDALQRTHALRIIASSEAGSIPFAALLERPAARVTPKSAFLVRRFALSATAGFASLAQPAQPARQNGLLLAVGAPTPFGAAPVQLAMAKPVTMRAVYRGGGVDVSSLSALAPLSASASEAVAIARRFGPARATLLVGDAASEDGLAALDLAKYRTVIFATHALLAGEMEGVAEPALVLARPGAGAMRDGVLTASEIGQLRLDADWVILSGCNTAGGEGGTTQAYSGLAQAFRYAGARTMLLSQWPVRDDAAARLTEATLTAAARGQRPADALRTAMLTLMSDRTIDNASDPRIWAPFILFE